MRKNYNYKRRKLFLPEYGRHIQEMVDSLLEIEDRQERTRQAKAVIAVMGNLNPLLRDTNGFKHKLWDHLFIMSDFQLDVDSPYPQPSRQDLMVVPQKLRYPQSNIAFKHYGKYTQQLVRAVAAAQGDNNASDELINIARYMRVKSYEFNNDHPNNEVIIRDIRAMAGNDMQIDMSAISALEKNGAPSSGFENLSNISNWVANAGLTERQFPIEEYVSAMKKLRTGDIHSAKSDMGKALCILPTLDKLRAAAIVEALARKDIEGADKIYSGFCGSATRWKMVSECYYMSATGGVSRATKQFIECHKKYPTTVYQIARDSYWGLSRWFDETEIVKAIQD